MEEGIVIDFRLEQPEKASPPIDVTEFGMFIEASFEQLAKA